MVMACSIKPESSFSTSPANVSIFPTKTTSRYAVVSKLNPPLRPPQKPPKKIAPLMTKSTSHAAHRHHRHRTDSSPTLGQSLYQHSPPHKHKNKHGSILNTAHPTTNTLTKHPDLDDKPRPRRSSMAELTRHPAWLENAGFMRRSKCSACHPDPEPSPKSILNPPDVIAVPIFGVAPSTSCKKKRSWCSTSPPSSYPHHHHHPTPAQPVPKRRTGGSAPTIPWHPQLPIGRRSRSCSQPALPTAPSALPNKLIASPTVRPPPVSLCRAQKKTDVLLPHLTTALVSPNGPSPQDDPAKTVALAAATAMIAAFAKQQHQYTPAQRLLLQNQLSQPGCLDAMVARILHDVKMAHRDNSHLSQCFFLDADWLMSHQQSHATLQDTPILQQTPMYHDQHKTAVEQLYDTLTDAAYSSDDTLPSASSISSTLPPLSSTSSTSSSPLPFWSRWLTRHRQENKKPDPLMFQGMARLEKQVVPFVLHLNPLDDHPFHLLPHDQWIPDQQVPHCQLDSCSAPAFSWLHRRHHCRRCGKIICQAHSQNKMPLLKDGLHHDWYRVCDVCCDQLISFSK
ncbi:hypothetical protein DM01DRAFT_1384919 [Hesseltinella vesiculosa]|uniref:FYVE-type domain-containing protein n=1 Tax=Hesseltinella vesiculosa TaxID=101127 RepID=A0A1X2GD58_9FUNG|nr:hypothetical protein DM01DRAFT_1384919 [Hesseltinella vesiculosa]